MNKQSPKATQDSAWRMATQRKKARPPPPQPRPIPAAGRVIPLSQFRKKTVDDRMIRPPRSAFML